MYYSFIYSRGNKNVNMAYVFTYSIKNILAGKDGSEVKVFYTQPENLKFPDPT